MSATRGPLYEIVYVGREGHGEEYGHCPYTWPELLHRLLTWPSGVARRVVVRVERVEPAVEVAYWREQRAVDAAAPPVSLPLHPKEK